MRDPRRRDPRLLPAPLGWTPADVIGRRNLSRVVPVLREEGRRTAEGPAYLPPWIYPPFVHFPVDEPQNRIPTVIAIANSLIITWKVIPQGATGVVRRIGISTADAANTRITTRINGNPVPPFGGIIGAIGSLENPTELPGPVIVRAGEEFSLLLENVGVVNIAMAARTMGWLWVNTS